MRIPITSQLAALVLVIAGWSAWTGPAERVDRDQAVVAGPAALDTVEIIVRNAHLDGAPTWVSVCGNKVLLESDRLPGSALQAKKGCLVEAIRSDGSYRARSEAVAFTGESLTLTLPPYRVGGIGVELDERDGRVFVGGLLEGGAALEVGIRVGNLLVDAEGLPYTSAREMQDEVLGPDQTFVNVGVIRYKGASVQLQMFTLQRRSDVE